MTDTLSRREFTETLGLAALGPLFAAAEAARPAMPWARTPLVPSAGVPVLDPSALARALAEAVRVQYGERLDAEALETIRRQIEAGLERSAKIRKVALANGDEPQPRFAAFRAEGR